MESQLNFYGNDVNKKAIKMVSDQDDVKTIIIDFLKWLYTENIVLKQLSICTYNRKNCVGTFDIGEEISNIVLDNVILQELKFIDNDTIKALFKEDKTSMMMGIELCEQDWVFCYHYMIERNETSIMLITEHNHLTKTIQFDYVK